MLRAPASPNPGLTHPAVLLSELPFWHLLGHFLASSTQLCPEALMIPQTGKPGAADKPPAGKLPLCPQPCCTTGP